MNTPSIHWPAIAVLAGALAVPSFAAANQQQASFAVAVTLHTAVKPLSAAQLCRDGRPTLQTLGAIIQVDCPKNPTPVQRGPSDTAHQPPVSSGDSQARPEVTVIF